jgi:hypothetical protein
MLHENLTKAASILLATVALVGCAGPPDECGDFNCSPAFAEIQVVDASTGERVAQPTFTEHGRTAASCAQPEDEADSSKCKLWEISYEVDRPDQPVVEHQVRVGAPGYLPKTVSVKPTQNGEMVVVELFAKEPGT